MVNLPSTFSRDAEAALEIGPGKSRRPELFFGFVSPMGVGGGNVIRALGDALDRVNYRHHTVRLIDELSRLEALPAADENLQILNQLRRHRDEAHRYELSIRAGDVFCAAIDRAALVALGITRIQEIRQEQWLEVSPNLPRMHPLAETAYIFRSLKRPEEVDSLRIVYGDAFFLISAYAPRETRIDSLARKFTSLADGKDPDRAREIAERLMNADAKEEGQPAGQNVRNTFDKADVFLDASRNRSELVAEVGRFINLLFGFQFHTPRRDEEGMAVADLASLSSAHLGRQVGAAIMAPDGAIVATGCNEVPRAGGSRYRANEDPDARDYQLRRNTSREVRQEVLGDLLNALSKIGWLERSVSSRLGENYEQFIEGLRDQPTLMHARIMDAIEYDRSVHAEMAALCDAARRGIPVGGSTLYCTTFPCHNCARHIVHSGIKRVVFIHPYEKSYTKRLHGDAIAVDLAPHIDDGRVRFDPFVGVAPTLYATLFTMQQREGDGERWKSVAAWRAADATPRRKGEAFHYLRFELTAVSGLLEALREKNVDFPWRFADQ